MSRTLAVLAAVFALGSIACGRSTSTAAPTAKNAIDVVIETDPPGGTIIVDGAAVGASPAALKLNRGPHRIRASMNGYLPAPETRIQVGEDQPKKVTIPLVASH